MGKSTISMVIFNSYVSLPEGRGNLPNKHWLVVVSTPLKNDGVSNSWDDHSQDMGKIKAMFQTTNQYITIIFPLLLVYTLLTTINIHGFSYGFNHY